jgi:hypothetical protein
LEVPVFHFLRSFLLLTFTITGAALHALPAPAAASTSQNEVQKLDLAFARAINHADQAAIAKWLDSEFT